MPNQPTFAAEVAALNERVTNIEGGLRSVADAVTALGTKLDSRSQTNWQPIWSALGVMTAILGLAGAVVYSPIKASQDRAERDIYTLDTRMREGDTLLRNDIVPRRELDVLLSQHTRSLDRIYQRLDRIEQRGAH